jgi:hypothetical protein
MICPACGAELLFGCTTCACGGTATSHERLPIDLSYWEAVPVYWRVYWPSQVALLITSFGLAAAGRRFPIAAQVCLAALLLFALVGRMISRPFRGFSLRLVPRTAEDVNASFSLRRRTLVWFFLWWRQMVAALMADFLARPLNVLLSLLGVHCAPWIALFAVVLVIGPILVIMLVGHQFSDFRLEAERAPIPRSAC